MRGAQSASAGEHRGDEFGLRTTDAGSLAAPALARRRNPVIRSACRCRSATRAFGLPPCHKTRPSPAT
eukprot:scaffold275491_cov28-Tisochrysis_lutea.AAC.9